VPHCRPVTHLDRATTTAALLDEFAAFDQLTAGLDPGDWSLPTALPGWNVQANVVHVLGTEAMLLGEPTPAIEVDTASLPHVRNDIGALNEAWVIAMADLSPTEVLHGFRQRVAQRRVALDAMSDDDWEAESFTPAGPDTYGRFMRIRVMDIWMHEQDIREAVGRPGNDHGPVVELVLDEMQAALGFVVGKRAGAPDGSSVTFDLTGESGRQLHVAVDGRAALVDALPGGATVTLSLPLLAFTRLAGGRTTDASSARISGDEDLGRQVLANLGYMI
jgi:uncharacterized protein (TIGR03083 family)